MEGTKFSTDWQFKKKQTPSHDMLHTYVDVGGREGYKQLLHEDRQVGYQLGPCHSRERERERERERSAS